MCIPEMARTWEAPVLLKSSTTSPGRLCRIPRSRARPREAWGSATARASESEMAPARAVQPAVEGGAVALVDKRGPREGHYGADPLSIEIGRVVKPLQLRRRLQRALQGQPVSVPEVRPVSSAYQVAGLAHRDQELSGNLGPLSVRPVPLDSLGAEAEPGGGAGRLRDRY